MEDYEESPGIKICSLYENREIDNSVDETLAIDTKNDVTVTIEGSAYIGSIFDL